LPGSREILDRFLLDLDEPLDGLEDAALVALWRVGARRRWQAVTAERAGWGTSGYPARRFRSLERLLARGLAERERVWRTGVLVWFLTEKGWTAAELAAEEEGLSLWLPADEDARMLFA
jgi:hypothetical protein